MTISQTKNLTTANGYNYVIVELGDILFFGGNVQKFLEVTHFENERPMSDSIDLIQFEKETGILPIVFEK